MQRLAAWLVMGSCLAVAPASAEPRYYDASEADQLLGPLAEDVVPHDAEAREIWARQTAYDAAVFGLPAVMIYRQMHDQAIDRASPDFTGFNRLAHGRDLAGPGYKPFKSPNADTLYSNAYLDLSRGPVLLDVPPTAGRYYTVNFLDMFGNATNISARTHGTDGGQYLIAPTGWGGEVPEGATLFRVTQPYMWILMRIEAEDAAALPVVRALQDRFTLTPLRRRDLAGDYPAPGSLDDPASFLAVLDWIVEQAGVRDTEKALVHQFRGLGVGGPVSAGEALADSHMLAGVRQGFADAALVVERIKRQKNADAGGWRETFDPGRYGFNYLFRSGLHSLGTGANVRIENFTFTTFADAEGEALDGSKHDYVLRFDTPPPSDFFWSVTAYDLRTQELIPNSDRKYLVGGNTEGLEIAEDGSVTIRLSRGAQGPNALPLPDGPFYLALRAQGPRREMVTGSWRPSPVRKAGTR